MNNGHKVLFTMDRTATERIKFSIEDYKGKPWIDIRVFFNNPLDFKDKDYHHTKKGMKIAPEQFRDFKRGIEAVETELKKRKLFIQE